MRTLLLTIVLLSLNYMTVDCVEVQCEYFTGSLWIVGSAYTCEVKNQDVVVDRSDRVITDVSKNHENGKSNDDVKNFGIADCKAYYYPRGIEKIFKNLESIWCRSSGLRELTKDDLKPFAKLREISLQNNELEVLEEGLFVNNPLLEGIYINRNKIFHIDSKAFDHLNRLRDLYLSANECPLEHVRNDSEKLKELIAKIRGGSCKDGSKMFQNFMKDMKLFMTKLEERVFNIEKQLGAP